MNQQVYDDGHWGRLVEDARQRGYKLSEPDSPAEYGYWLAWDNLAQWVADLDAVRQFILTDAATRTAMLLTHRRVSG